MARASTATGRDYHFDGSISEAVLRNYLSRAMTTGELLTERGNLDDNIRMLRKTGVKFAGRSVVLWGAEGWFPQMLPMVKRNAAKVHEADPNIILEACVFEIVSRDVEKVPVPDWVFKAFDLPVEQRNFRYDGIIYESGRGRNHWGKEASVPDISRQETKLWFYCQAASYINAGVEAIHFGQMEIMNGNDPKFEHWRQLLTMVRQYGAQHARRHLVLCNAHVPNGGPVDAQGLLLDFHEFPLRIAEVKDRPLEGVLQMHYIDSLYGRSRGGVTPSGWRCEHLPYLVEFDNWGVSDKPGQPNLGGCWVWGYDEICWFALQSESYRNDWIRYAWKWVREHDPAGYVEMPGIRCLANPVDGKAHYFANKRSNATPNGFGQEETIRDVWAGDSTSNQ
jgi:hypothetical protein